MEIHQRLAYSAAYKILLNSEDAKDAAQESFIKLWKNIDRFNFEAKFTTWFYKIVINMSLDKLKARKRKEENLYSITDRQDFENLFLQETPDYSEKEFADIVAKLTESLSPKQKIVFTLRDLNGLDIGLISESLNMSPGTVKTNLVYARRRIKELLAKIYKWE